MFESSLAAALTDTLPVTIELPPEMAKSSFAATLVTVVTPEL
jgi:hypothetical protein